MFSLTGKVAVVTGGASGVGLATAHRLASAGARVVVADVIDGTAVAHGIGGEFVRTDVSIDEEMARLMDTTLERFGALDVVVNNAGIAAGEGPVTNDEDEPYLLQFRVNTLGVVHGIKHGARHMKEGGSIVNVASVAAAVGFPNFGTYSVSKSGVVAITRTAAVELGGRGIRVNCVCPAAVATGMLEGDDVLGEIAYHEAVSPLGRVARPEEVAAAIHFLASDDCAYVNGHALFVDGGLTVGPSAGFIEWLTDRWRGER
jgi:NAD(P)-dependent dehydrogenase (short-subunit alcohol dehydrogenase family)